MLLLLLIKCASAGKPMACCSFNSIQMNLYRVKGRRAMGVNVETQKAAVSNQWQLGPVVFGGGVDVCMHT